MDVATVGAAFSGIKTAVEIAKAIRDADVTWGKQS